MRTFVFCILGLIAGYAAGALIGAGLIELMSGNAHDKGVEAAMTAAFVTGPIGAVAGIVAALVIARRNRR